MPPENSRRFDLRLTIAAILLAPAIYFTWLTIDGLAARRALRTDLAEITHARYGLLSADRWRDIIGPILNVQIDKLDLKTQSRNLRPMVERSLYQLLDNIKQQMTAPPPAAKTDAKADAKPGAKMPGQGNAFLVNMIFGSLRPHVPEYTNVVLAELAKPDNQKAFKEAVRGVLAESVKNTFSAVNMTTYSSILKAHGCADGAACEKILGQKIGEADERIQKYYLIVLVLAAAAFAALFQPAPGDQAALLQSKKDRVQRADAEADLLIGLRQSDNETLKEIEAALVRINRGTFGECEVCKKPLSKARLEAMPWTRVCLECKEKGT
jgi:RNA polymerase-binding transcription factor DksA